MKQLLPLRLARRLTLPLALTLTVAPMSATGGPAQCFYYLHNKLAAPSVETCMSKADTALRDQGFPTKARETSDGYVSFVEGETTDSSAQVMCYEVHGRRGKIMAYITVAGARACPIAENIFETLKRPSADP